MKYIEQFKRWLSKGNRALWVATLSMIALGTIAITYISPYQAIMYGWPMHTYTQMYIPYLLLGLAMLWGCSKMSKNTMVRFSYILMGFSVFLLLVSLYQPHYVRGAARMVPLFGINLNPYMLLLPAYIVLVSHWLSKCTDKKNMMFRWIGCAVLTMFICMCAFLAPYMSMVMIYVTAFGLMTMKLNKDMPKVFKASLLLVVGFTAGVFIIALSKPYVAMKLAHSFSGDSYQVHMAHRAISETGLLWYTQESIGSIASVQDIATDFMWTGIVGRFGLCAGILVLMLMFWTGRIITKNISDKEDTFVRLLNVGVLGVFAISAFFNFSTSVGGAMHSSYLPFFSFAKTTLLSFCLMFGFLLANPEKK